MSSITPEFLKQKAREISYALNRVSFYIKRDELRNRLERLSFEFLENVAAGSEDASDTHALLKVFKNIAALDVLIRIGHSLYEIEPVNANILIKEIDSFNSAIRQFGNASASSAQVRQFGNPFGDELPNLETIFSMPPAVIENPETIIDKEKEIVEKAYSAGGESGLPTRDLPKGDNSANEGNNSVPTRSRGSSIQPCCIGTNSVSVRQELIVDKVRQLGKASLRELLARFPGVSERTLRYDLQKLCDQGFVEKVGNSGPGTSYAPKKPNP